MENPQEISPDLLHDSLRDKEIQEHKRTGRNRCHLLVKVDGTWYYAKSGKKMGYPKGKPRKNSKKAREAEEAEKKEKDNYAFMLKASKCQNFPEMWLGLKPYKWQKDVLQTLDHKEARVALKAANGSGKTSVCAAAAVLWHMIRFPESLVVCTAGVWRQVEDQLWPTMRKYTLGLGEGWTVFNSEIRYGNGSRAIGFSTSDPGKFEGWHRQGPSENLLMVIVEAKTVPDSIFEAVERCQPSRILMMSSPGGTSGAFYRAFTKEARLWSPFSVAASE